MPRRTERPECNLPEILYITAHFTPRQLQERKRRLCTHCLHNPCRMLPITTKGEDCPYSEQGLSEKPDA